MSFFTDIFLRIVNRADFNTKGSNLTNQEVDNNFLAIVDEMAARDVKGQFPNWAAGTYAAGRVVKHNGLLWISTTSTTGEPSVSGDWSRVDMSVAAHERNRDTQLVTSGGVAVTADSLSNVVNAGQLIPFSLTLENAEISDLHNTHQILVPSPSNPNVVRYIASIYHEKQFPSPAVPYNNEPVFGRQQGETVDIFEYQNSGTNLIGIGGEGAFLPNKAIVVEADADLGSAGNGTFKYWGYYVDIFLT
jgi:hypothetical protein